MKVVTPTIAARLEFELTKLDNLITLRYDTILIVGNVMLSCCRIRTESHGGAWCPKQEATSDPKEWLEINLHQVYVITAVETQGRFGNGQGQEYTEAYQIEYWRPKLGNWKRYRNVKGQDVSFLKFFPIKQ